MYAVEDLAKFFKEILPEVKIVLGGPEATVKDAELLKKPCFDLVVRNEGEYTLLEVLNFYKYGRGSLEEIKGLTYKKGNEIFRNQDRSYIENLDELPFLDHDLVGGQGYLYPVITGRGCPYKCIFCFGEALGRNYRYRTPANVVEEVIFGLEKYGLKSLSIFDDTFVTDIERTKNISRRLIEYQKTRKERFIFFCEGRVDSLSKDIELLQLLKDAGLARLQIGIESGSQKILNNFKKGITTSQVREVVHNCFKMGIPSVVGNFIFGGPGEDKNTVEETISFAKELINLAPGVFEASSSFLVPYMGTEIAKNPHKFGLKRINGDFYTGATLQMPFFETKSLNKKELIKSKRRFEKEIYNQMKKKLKDVPEDFLRMHFYLAENHRLFTNWYLWFYKKMPVLDGYYHFQLSHRFKKLNDINNDNWQDYYPMRLSEDISYRDDLSIILRGSLKEIILKDKIDKFIYMYSSGRLKTGEIAERVKNTFKLKENPPEIFKEVLLPFYQKLEKNKYIIFYE